MKTFKLVTKSGETINKFCCENHHEAVEYFSKVKRLSKKVLLTLFIVENI